MDSKTAIMGLVIPNSGGDHKDVYSSRAIGIARVAEEAEVACNTLKTLYLQKLYIYSRSIFLCASMPCLASLSFQATGSVTTLAFQVPANAFVPYSGKLKAKPWRSEPNSSPVLDPVR